jgi:rRNA maturation endonuclease Nob1
MQIITSRARVVSGGKQTRGPSEKDMVCCVCYRFFNVNESSWAAAERKKCPHCGSRDTTPILGEYYDAVPVLVRGPDGGYI